MKRSYYIVPLLLLGIAWMRPPAHLKTSWGSYTGGAIDTNAARAVLDSPLSVTDNRGGTYTVTRFRFSYRQKSEYEDSTGKVITNYQLYSREFYDTPLVDSLWRSDIQAEVQPGEAYFIDNVVVKNAKGVKALAPSLELDVQ